MPPAVNEAYVPVIPYRSNAKNKPRFFPMLPCKTRARIEQAIGKLKRFNVSRCAVKTAESYAAIATSQQNKDAAGRLGVDQATVITWRRFGEFRIDKLGMNFGLTQTNDDARIAATIVRTLESAPGGATHWRVWLSVSTVHNQTNFWFRTVAPRGPLLAGQSSSVVKSEDGNCRR